MCLVVKKVFVFIYFLPCYVNYFPVLFTPPEMIKIRELQNKFTKSTGKVINVDNHSMVRKEKAVKQVNKMHSTDKAPTSHSKDYSMYKIYGTDHKHTTSQNTSSTLKTGEIGFSEIGESTTG